MRTLPGTVALMRKHGIITVGSFMIGLPGEDREHILQTFAFARRLKLDYIEIGILAPYPKTKLYNEYLEKKTIVNDFWLELAKDPLGGHRHFTLPVCTDKLGRKDLYSLMNIGYRSFYINSEYIFRNLLKIRNIEHLLNQFLGAYFLYNELKQKN